MKIPLLTGIAVGLAVLTLSSCSSSSASGSGGTEAIPAMRSPLSAMIASARDGLAGVGQGEATRKAPPAETPGYTPRSAPPEVKAVAAVVCDAKTGRILYRKNPDKRRAVASTQKLMTALIVESEGGLDKTATVMKGDIEVEPSTLKLREGETYPRRQLFEGMLVRSGNDAARCLARDNAGSYDAFARKMNAMARRLNMHNTNFLNPSGLTVEGQYSTARDMAKLAMVAHRNPTIRKIVSKKELGFKHAASGKVESLLNTNVLLKQSTYCTGMKTGYTSASGRCLVASGSKAGQQVIAVVLGSGNLQRGRNQIWKDTGGLLDWGLNELAPVESR